MALYRQSVHDLLNARIPLANTEEPEISPCVQPLRIQRAWEHAVERKVGLRTLNEVRPQHPVVSEAAMNAR